MRGARAVMVCLVAALALPGCMHAAGPVAMAQPQSDLDSLAAGPGSMRMTVPLGTAISPGDTVLVGERWF
jgi:hypothetical protein